MYERCENCAYYCKLEHKFSGFGYVESHCCLYFVLAEKERHIVEVFANDRCEVFKRRANDAIFQERQIKRQTNRSCTS